MRGLSVVFGRMPVPLPVVTSPPGPGASWDTVTVVAALEGLWVCGIGGTPAGLWVAFAVDVGTTAGSAVVVSVAAVRVDGEVAVGVEAVLADITVGNFGCLLVVASGDTVTTATVVVVPVAGVVSSAGVVSLGGVVSLAVVILLAGVVPTLPVVPAVAAILLAGVVLTGAVVPDVGVLSELSPVVAVAAVVMVVAVVVAAGVVAVGSLPLTPGAVAEVSVGARLVCCVVEAVVATVRPQ